MIGNDIGLFVGICRDIVEFLISDETPALGSYSAAIELAVIGIGALFPARSRCGLDIFGAEIILDLGAGTGQGTLGLAKQYPEACIVAMDLAEQMLKKNRDKIASQKGLVQRVKTLFNSNQRHQFVCADAEQLPFADASVDLIFSNLTIQWCLDLPTLFNEFRRVLKPGGLLMFTTLGTETLNELRASWAEVSDKIHVNEFADMHAIDYTLFFYTFFRRC